MKSESAVEDRVRLLAPQLGGVLWRNNVGAYKDDTGRQIRYGLVNDSAKVNRKIKSSDLIGVMPLVIRPEHVGRTLGLFVAVECKREGWQYGVTGGVRDAEREAAQLKFLELVHEFGGLACFAANAEDFEVRWRLV